MCPKCNPVADWSFVNLFTVNLLQRGRLEKRGLFLLYGNILSMTVPPPLQENQWLSMRRAYRGKTEGRITLGEAVKIEVFVYTLLLRYWLA